FIPARAERAVPITAAAPMPVMLAAARIVAAPIMAAAAIMRAVPTGIMAAGAVAVAIWAGAGILEAEAAATPPAEAYCDASCRQYRSASDLRPGTCPAEGVSRIGRLHQQTRPA